MGLMRAIPQIIGHGLSVILLLLVAVIIRVLDWLVRALVACIQAVTGATVERDSVKFHTQRESATPEYEGEACFIDEKKTRESVRFPLSPDELIKKTKELAGPDSEFGSKKPELLAEDFQFVFPIVGPLSKEEFCTIFGGFKLKEAFPHSPPNFFGFTPDPIEPNRVWFFSRSTLTHTGTLRFAGSVYPPTGKRIVQTPQVLSMSFDLEGRCYKLTGGYSVDRTVGDCGGLGGVFGIIHALGGSLPFPEGKPWKPSLEWEAAAKRIPEIIKLCKR